MVQVTRRRRVSVATKDKAEDSIARLNEIAERNRKLMDQISKINHELTELGTEASALMQFLKLKELEVPGFGTHTYLPTRKNAKNIVDPKAFKERVSDNEFWQAVTVGIGEAKRFLGDKELSEITTTIPGGEGPAVYKFK